MGTLSIAEDWERCWPEICNKVGNIMLKFYKQLALISLKNFFYFFKLINLFLAALGLHCCAQAFSSCSEWGLLFVEVRGVSFSCCGARALGARASVVAACGLSSCGARA